MRRLAIVVFVLLGLGVPARARAQAVPAARDGAGLEHGRTLELSGLFFAEAWDFNGRPGAALVGGTASVALPVHGRWAAVLEGLAINIDERRRNTLVGGVSILVRRQIAECGATTVFLEGGAGVSYASQPVPAGGTRFNYPLQAGGGVARRFGPHVGGLLSLRLFHLSNKSLDGPSRNPDIEALGGHVGIFISF
jgi:hypothetical protein